jgi:hypothetical protein
VTRTKAIDALKPNESAAFAQRLVAATPDEITTTIRAMKNNMAPALARLKKRYPEREWVVDTATTITHDRNAVVAMIVVTRVDEEDDL